MGRREGKSQPCLVLEWLIVIGSTMIMPGLSSAQLRVVTSSVVMPPAASLVERSVAQVDRTIITLSELLIEARLNIVRESERISGRVLDLNARDIERVLWTLSEEAGSSESLELAEFLSTVLSVMVQRALLMTEVRRLQLREVSDEDVQAAYVELERAVRQKAVGIDTDRFMVEGGFRTEEGTVTPSTILTSILRSEIAVGKIRSFRRAARRGIPESALQVCFRARSVELSPLTYDDVKVRLEAEMRSRSFAAGLARQLQKLVERVEVRYSPPFESRALAPPDPCPPASALR